MWASQLDWSRTCVFQESGNNQVVFMPLDLADFRSVHSFAETFLETEPRLDILINNAGEAVSRPIPHSPECLPICVLIIKHETEPFRHNGSGAHCGRLWHGVRSKPPGSLSADQPPLGATEAVWSQQSCHSVCSPSPPWTYWLCFTGVHKRFGVWSVRLAKLSSLL